MQSTNANELFISLHQRISAWYEPGEAKSITYLLLDTLFGLERKDIVTAKDIILSREKITRLTKVLSRLENQEPVQYILGETEFYGWKFIVNGHVLIPRPETEELVHLIVQEHKSFIPSDFSLLDIGTGSGCIPVTLKKEWPAAEVFSLDVDENALSVAKKNAEKHDAAVTFLAIDILTTTPSLAPLDIVVSNPPYVLQKETGAMKPNVLDFEPPEALFVPDENPLIFYERIAHLATTGLLKNNGRLYLEINEAYGKAIISLLQQKGLKEVAIFKDMQEKDRMVRAVFRN